MPVQLGRVSSIDSWGQFAPGLGKNRLHRNRGVSIGGMHATCPASPERPSLCQDLGTLLFTVLGPCFRSSSPWLVRQLSAGVSGPGFSVHSVWCGKNRQPSRLNDRGYGTTAEALEYSKFSCMRTGLGGITAEGAEAGRRFPPPVLAALLPRN